MDSRLRGNDGEGIGHGSLGICSIGRVLCIMLWFPAYAGMTVRASGMTARASGMTMRGVESDG